MPYVFFEVCSMDSGRSGTQFGPIWNCGNDSVATLDRTASDATKRGETVNFMARIICGVMMGDDRRSEVISQPSHCLNLMENMGCVQQGKGGRATIRYPKEPCDIPIVFLMEG